MEEQRFRTKEEEERKKNKKKEREKQRIWDPAWGNQMGIQTVGDSNLIVSWMDGNMEDQQSKVQDDGAQDAEHAGQD